MVAVFVLAVVVICGNAAIVSGDGIIEKVTLKEEEEEIAYQEEYGTRGVYTERDDGESKTQTSVVGSQTIESGSAVGQKRRQKFLHRKKYKRIIREEEEDEERQEGTKTENRSNDEEEEEEKKEAENKYYDREMPSGDVRLKQISYKKIKDDSSKFKRNFYEFSSSDNFLTVTSSSYPPSTWRQQQQGRRKLLKRNNEQGHFLYEDYTNDSPNNANSKCGGEGYYAQKNSDKNGDNSVIRASVILPSDSDSYELSLSRVLPVLHLAEATVHRTGLLPKHLNFEFIVSDDHCDAVYAQIGTFNAIKRNVHVFFGPACEYSVGK